MATNPEPAARAVYVGSKPTAEELAHAAARALAAPTVRIHGVSVYVTDPSKWRTRDFGVADVLQLQTAFPMHKTLGRGHYTVELPQPVTPEVSTRFNCFFQWMEADGHAV